MIPKNGGLQRFSLNYSKKELKRDIRSGPFAWPGGYPTYFVTSDGAALSHRAVRENFRLIPEAIRDKDDSGWRVVGFDVNWEDPLLFCDHTGDQIESAYGED